MTEREKCYALAVFAIVWTLTVVMLFQSAGCSTDLPC